MLARSSQRHGHLLPPQQVLLRQLNSLFYSCSWCQAELKTVCIPPMLDMPFMMRPVRTARYAVWRGRTGAPDLVSLWAVIEALELSVSSSQPGFFSENLKQKRNRLSIQQRIQQKFIITYLDCFRLRANRDQVGDLVRNQAARMLVFSFACSSDTHV